MPAKIKKIGDFPDSPELVIGVLASRVKQIKHIVGVVIWDDERYEMVCDAMPLPEYALAVHVLQRVLFREIDEGE